MDEFIPHNLLPSFINYKFAYSLTDDDNVFSSFRTKKKTPPLCPRRDSSSVSEFEKRAQF